MITQLIELELAALAAESALALTQTEQAEEDTTNAQDA